MPENIWFKSPTGKLLQVHAVKDADGWAIRISDEKGNRASPLVYRVSYEVAADAMMGEMPIDIVEGLMHLAVQDVKDRENEILRQPIPKS